MIRSLFMKTAVIGFCTVFSLCSVAPAGNVLMGSGAKAKAAVNSAYKNTKDWSDNIQQMLDAGKYEEGVVVAGISKEKTGSGLADKGRDILTVDESSVEEAADENGQEIRDCGDIEIRVIRNKAMTTKEILSELAGDDSVVFAEPNYIAKNSSVSDEESEDRSASLTEGEPGDTSELKPAKEIKDMTALQYSNSKDSTLHAPGDLNPSINVPDFGATGSNMKGDPVTVAVLDYPVDFSNEDLGKVAYTFTDEEQKKLGCDVHGFNATWQSKDGKLKPFKGGNHGTHCAGIIGAAWDGKGISGVASNVRIVSIQNSIEDGRTSLINALNGLDFVKRANEQTDADIRLVSNSWGLVQSSLALNAAIMQLGKEQGVVNIFAAGNEGSDISHNDYIANTLVSNPYVVSVASTDFACCLSPFSNYGGTAVDLAAPGSTILSTVMSDVLTYIPDAVDTNKIYEGFEGEEPAVKISQQDAQGEEKGKAEIVSGRDEYGYAGEHALRLDLDGSADTGSNPDYYHFNIVMDAGDVSDKDLKVGNSIALSYLTDNWAVITEAWFMGTDGEWLKCSDDFSMRMKENEWRIFNATLPEGTDLKNLKVRLTIAFDKTVSTGNKLYIDSVGVGDEGVPYAMYNGTSMACPAVSGATAVIISEDPQIKGKDLVDKIRSRVRRIEEFKGKLKTEGLMDLSAGSADNPPGPSISNVSVSGKTVTIKGKNFGSEAGSAKASKYVSGKKPKKKSGSVTSWSDTEIVIKLKKKFKGMVKAVVTSSSGKMDAMVRFISKSSNVYEKDLPLDSSTGEPFKMDAMGDLEVKGPMVAYKSKLFYMPAQTKVEDTPVFGSCYCYDTATGKWKKLTKLPANMEKLSACIYDGKLFVKGRQAKKNGTTGVFTYNIKKKTWKEESAAGVQNEETIFTDGKKVMLAGGYTSVDNNGEISGQGHVKVYSRSEGAGKTVADLAESMDGPLVTAFDKKIYVYDRNKRELTVVSNGKARMYRGALPERVNSDSKTDDASLVTVTDGVMLIGASAADGSSDTFLMKKGKKKFSPYKKRLSDGNPAQCVAAFCGNKIYAVAAAIHEKTGRVFRRTTYTSGARKVLVARAVMKGRKKAEFKWNKVKGADKYVIYLGAKRGKKFRMKKIKNISAGRSKWTFRKLKKKTQYKFIVAALDKNGKKYKTMTKSKAGYFVSGNVTKRFTNPERLSLNKNGITLKIGKKSKIKGRVSKKSYKKKLMTGRAPRVRYISSNNKVATVSKKGKVTGKGFGICRIYAFTINGIWKEVKVTVEP